MTDEEEIAAAVERFLRAYNAGDVETIAGYYADDLVKDRQGAPPEKKAETVARVRGVFRDFSGSLSVSNDEIVVSGDLAYARGTLRITLTPRAGGTPQRVERRFLEIWRKREGRWLVTRTMDNTAG
ncbi:MAG TPA: nuclear transport factor 2 family protein [Thermoanaerobaculia bacterium]|nr:nuclear transport factor 2 family protein [Thermoanaerobaculia bacterium]